MKCQNKSCSNIHKNERFCSNKCYNESGLRQTIGKVAGKKYAENYWKKFDEVFYKKYGHLDRVDQTRLLIQIGAKRVYRKTLKDKKSEKVDSSCKLDFVIHVPRGY